MKDQKWSKQLDAYKNAKIENKTEIGALHSVRKIDTNLFFTEVQKFIFNKKNIEENISLPIVQKLYNKKQKNKFKQFHLLKNGSEPITEKRYNIIENGKTVKSVGKYDTAEKHISERSNPKSYTIEEYENEISSNFSAYDILIISQKLSDKYDTYFTDKAKVTSERLLKCIQ